jgi:hypothetical protein
MRTVYTRVIVSILALGFGSIGLGTEIVKWDFSGFPGGAGNFGPSPLAATAHDANITPGGLTRGSGVGTNGTGAAKGWGGTHFSAGSQADAIASNDFATFSITVNSGYTVSLTNIAPYNIRHSGIGPTNGIWQFNVNGGDFTDIGTVLGWGTDTSATGNNQGAIPLGGIAGLHHLQGGTVVGFRIVSWGGASAGTWYLNDQTSGSRDLIVNGTVVVGGAGPTVAITNPVNNALFTQGASIPIDATATDGGMVTNVALYADGALLGNDTTAPYGWTWNGATVGSHVLRAVAWNNSGVSSTSEVVNLGVNAQGSGTGVFTKGNIVVYRVGDGVIALTNTGSAVFLDEYTRTGVLMQSLAMPTNVTGGNRPLIASGTATSEGLFTLSVNGRCLALTGYGTTPGGATVLNSSSAASIPRVAGVVNYDGAIDTTTALGDYSSGNNPRSAVTTDGTNIWVAGGKGGVRYTTRGSTSSTLVSTNLDNVRQVNGFGGQLYASTQSGANRLGIIGSGMPTSGQSFVNLPGYSTSEGAPNAFFMADLNHDGTNDTLYVADSTAGIQKYSLVGGLWTTNGVVAVSGYFGITGYVTGTKADLYATSASKLDHLTDYSGFNGAFSGVPSTLASASSNTVFRGVAPSPGAPPPPPPPPGTILQVF